MIISKFSTENFIYYDLHSEEVITSNFIEDVNLGIYCDRLQTITMERITIDIIDNGLQGSKNIAFDFTNIVAVQTNINSYFTKLKTDGYNLVFTNIINELIIELGYDSIYNEDNSVATIILIDKTTIKPLRKEGYSHFYFFETRNDFYPENFKVEPIFREHFKNKLKLYREEHDEQHTSSFVYLSSYINIKKFISQEKELCLYSIIKLASKGLKEWRQTAPIPPYFPDMKNNSLMPILVCQSLNSSYLVSILSNLLKLDVLILDQIGPINRIYNSMNKNIIQNRNYIVVSDLVCLGTEVKIAKNIIEFLGGKYLGNLALIKTETLKKSDIKKKDSTIAVFSIDRENNKELNYFITTDLANKHE